MNTRRNLLRGGWGKEPGNTLHLKNAEFRAYYITAIVTKLIVLMDAFE